MSLNVPLKWLESFDDPALGVTWGVPWKEGELPDADNLALCSGAGGTVPMSSWVTARWPDKSVKWTAHAAVLDGRESYSITAGQSRVFDGGLSFEESGEAVIVKTGKLSCIIPKSGPLFIKDLKLAGRDRGMDGVLSGKIRHARLIREGGRETVTDEYCAASVSSASVEQSSFNRLCVKTEGKLSLAEGGVPFLFILRLYFYLGSGDIRLVYTVINDIDQETQRLAGLSLDFSVPMAGEMYNRHVAFAGDTGLFTEAASVLLSMRGQGDVFYREQMALRLQKLEARDEQSEWFISKLPNAAVWKNFRLNQIGADCFQISKGTEPECSRVWAVSGKRAKGLVYVASEAGAAAFSVRDFWQKFPQSLEADALDADYGKVRLWIWSDEAPPYNFKAYDTRGHGLDFAYEGGNLTRSSPQGTANTTEISIRLYDSPPSKDRLWRYAEESQRNILLVCSPERYYLTRALGVWGMPNYENPVSARIEEAVAGLCDFYINQIELRSWYGFWNYGDVMHSYDPVRHVWRYDFGGCAWHNTELAPNLWLWHQFLRTGNARVFEFARIMTRHTSEVDCGHLGKLIGLGSRHNVVHWGSGCKETRIMQAFFHRPYYCLTGDERIGEIMDMVKDADYSAFEKDPMGSYFGGQHPGFVHVRSGPDWLAWVSNWMSQYERFGNEKYWQKLLRGLKSLEDDKLGLIAGPAFLYHPDDGRLLPMSDNNYHYHMVVAFGGSEVLLELERWLDGDKRLKQMIADFGKAYVMSDEEIRDFSGGRLQDKHEMSWKVYAAHLIAYGARHYRDPELGAKAWSLIIEGIKEISRNEKLNLNQVNPVDYPVPAEEIPGLSTNNAAQIPLAYFAAAELIPEYMPERF
jgi:hypothetical protein